jgi:protein-S-isoprenylcysteine O-methyltransferase Ste14
MNRSAFITTLVPAIAIAYLLVKFSDLSWTALRILALLLTIAGIAAVAVARYQLGNSFTLSPQARTLVTCGLYSKIRNPVYVFSAIALAGLFVNIDRPIYLVSFLALIPLQFIRAHIESRVLEEKFGDTYRQYKSKTWFWVLPFYVSRIFLTGKRYPLPLFLYLSFFSCFCLSPSFRAEAAERGISLGVFFGVLRFFLSSGFLHDARCHGPSLR